MYNCPLSSWAPTCMVTGAPKGVNPLNCLSEDIGCNGFRRSNCKFTGSFNQTVVGDLHSCFVSQYLHEKENGNHLS